MVMHTCNPVIPVGELEASLSCIVRPLSQPKKKGLVMEVIPVIPVTWEVETEDYEIRPSWGQS
jgi:hypothetical protein